MSTTDYYGQLRKDVLDAVPPGAKSILSVGCASGVTEEQLLKRGAFVAGIELNPRAAAAARTRGIRVTEGDASKIDVSQFGVTFDFIVYSDVLEHLPDPEATFRRHLEHLGPDGGVYICVPNFRHHSVLRGLVFRGEVVYSDAGILDRTHLRITTRKMVLRWVASAGLRPVEVRYHIYRRRDRALSFATCGALREFIASQVSVKAMR